MKPIFMFALAVLFSVHALAQNNLSGTIADTETGAPLPWATIYFPDLQKGTTTDSLGNYQLKDLPQGTFLVEVNYAGYSTKLTQVNILGNTTLNITLSSSVIEMGEIVIIGASAATERKRSPMPTIVISSLSESATANTNIIDAIARQPGISQISTGAAISKPVIRGLGYNRVVTLHNNIRQEGQQWGDEHGIEIDEYSVDRVEIIKGAGGIMYGSDAMAGVIHFMGPKPIENGKIIGKVLVNYQTNNNLSAYSAMNAGSIKNAYWRAQVSSKTAGNYENIYDGKVYNSGFEELNFNGSVGLKKKWGYSELNFSSFNQTLALSEGERDATGNFIKPVVVNDTTVEEQTVTSKDLDGYSIGTPSQRIEHLKISSSSKFFMKKSALALNIAFQQNTRKEFADPLDPQAEELYFLLNTLNYNLKYSFPELKNWKTAMGINGMQQSSKNKGEEFIIPEYSLFDAGLFVFTQKTFKKLNLSGGARYDLRTLNSSALYLNAEDEPTTVNDNSAIQKFSELKTSFSNFSASLGSSYEVNTKTIFKLNVSRGFRSPNMAELSSNGIHEGAFRYERGNPNMKPETNLQIDAGVIITRKHISVDLAVFNNSIHNYIYLQKLNSVFGGDSIMDVSEPAPTFQFKQGKANLYGGEITVDIHPHPWDWLHFQNSFAYVRGELLYQSDSTNNLSFIPAPQLQSELRADFKKRGKYFTKTFIKVEVMHPFQQNKILAAFGTETSTPAYTLLNAGAGFNVVNKNKNTLFTLSIIANNVLNIAYQSHLSRLKYAPENLATQRMGVFNMGRNISVKLVVPLEIKVH